MADFFEKEAVESDDTSDEEAVPKKRPKITSNSDSSSDSDSNDEIPDEDEMCRKEGAGWIVDEDEEDDEDQIGNRKSSKQVEPDNDDADGGSSDDDSLEDDDFQLLQENLGRKIKRQKKRRLVVEDDEDSNASSVSQLGAFDERRAKKHVEEGRDEIARQIFEDDEEDDERDDDAGGRRKADKVPTADPNLRVDEDDEEEGEEDDYEDDMGDFIVDENGDSTRAKRPKRVVREDAALQQAQEIFGVDMEELAEFVQPEDEDEDEEDEEDISDEDEDDGGEEAESRAQRRRATAARRKAREDRMADTDAINEMFDPSDLDRGYYTKEDETIRKTDIPERFQLRSVPIHQVNSSSLTYKADMEELGEEAEWIFKHAFRKGYITAQEPKTDNMGGGGANYAYTHKADHKTDAATPKIKEALIYMRENLLEVPFIAFYRKEYVEKELNINDLWRIWQWDEKWTQLRERKNNLTRSVQRMRDYLAALRLDETITREDIPPFPDKALSFCRHIDTLDEIHDVYTWFLLHYGDELPRMKQWEAKQRAAKKAAENANDTESKAEDEDEHEPEPDPIDTQPIRSRSSAESAQYRIALRAGLGNLIQRFGLSAECFAENMRDQYQRHEVDQCPMLPVDAAADFVSPQFPTPELALSAARHLLAKQIASEPLVRRICRRVFFDRARLKVRPTKKGRKEIDELHPLYSVKYVKNKPVSDIAGDIFLQVVNGATDQFLDYELSMDDQGGHNLPTYFDEIKQFFHRDEFSALVQAWNDERCLVIQQALDLLIYPQLRKELRARLLSEAYDGIVKLCARKLFNWIQVSPYSVDSGAGGRQLDELRSGGHGNARIMAITYTDDKDSSAFAVLIDGGGEVMDFLKLPGIKYSTRSFRTDFRKEKVSDVERLTKFILRYRPHAIGIGCESRVALNIQEDVTAIVRGLEAEHELAPIQVELVDNEPALVYENCKKALLDFPEYPGVLRQAVSLARRLQDPLIEFSQLMNPDEDILSIRFHPLQDSIPKDLLLQALEIEFINRVNEVGVDINRCLEYPHTANLVKFVSGLGPRKGFGLLKSLKQKNTQLNSRYQLVMVCKLGPHVVINCAGFIRIDTSSIRESSDFQVEVLDGTRVHPESYDLARKMAVDALEYDDADEMNPSDALEEILDSPERLRDLDLDAFAEELKRQDHGDKHITLYDIRKELNHRYKDLRQSYRPPNAEERFNMVTKETPDTFHVGRLIECQVVRVATRKPRPDQLDNANPVRSENTGLWICPFCQQEDFQELSAVWNHFDANECPGQAMGLRCILDNGVFGFVPTRLLSDRPVVNLNDRVRPGMMIFARITKIDIEKFNVDLSCRTSDLQDHGIKWRPQRDIYYDQDAEELDDRVEQERHQQKKVQPYTNRVIFHPQFKNITYGQYEKLVPSMDIGEVVIRPSSKGEDHLTVSWKVDEGVVHHIDVVELNKANAFSLGKILRIDNEEFEDLDEIVARYVQPMVSFVREVLAYRYYRDTQGGNLDIMSEILRTEKNGAPSRIPYFLSSTKKYPGKFLLSYLPGERPRNEYVTVTPDGFRFRDQMFDTVTHLITWFKAHFSDPLPYHSSQGSTLNAHNSGGRASASHTPMIGTTPMMSIGTPNSQPYRTPTMTDPRHHSSHHHNSGGSHHTTSGTPSSRHHHHGSTTGGSTSSRHDRTPRSSSGGSSSHRHHGGSSSGSHHHHPSGSGGSSSRHHKSNTSSSTANR